MQVKLLPCRHHHTKRKHAMHFYEMWSSVCFSEKVCRSQVYSGKKKHLIKLERRGGVVKTSAETQKANAAPHDAFMDWYFTSGTCNWLFMQLKTTLNKVTKMGERSEERRLKIERPCEHEYGWNNDYLPTNPYNDPPTTRSKHHECRVNLVLSHAPLLGPFSTVTGSVTYLMLIPNPNPALLGNYSKGND